MEEAWLTLGDAILDGVEWVAETDTGKAVLVAIFGVGLCWWVSILRWIARQ